MAKSYHPWTIERNQSFPSIPTTVCQVRSESSTDTTTIARSKARATTQRLPHLLRIAPELREQIYRELLHDRPSSLFHLLVVNRQISREVKPWTFRQPLTFNGQQSLYRWLALVDPGFLPNVINIRLVLHDLMPDQIMVALGERLAKARLSHIGSQPSGWAYDEAFDRELWRIRSAISRFTNLRSFTLLENASGDPEPPHRMLIALAALLLRELPLVSFMMPHSVRYATDQSQFPTLRHLQISGYKTRQTLGFPQIFEPFPNLCSLQICNGVQCLTPENRERSICQQPIGPSGTLPTLKELVVCMYSNEDRPRGNHSTFGLFELDTLAIRKYAKSLEVFKLLCKRWVDRSSRPMQQFFSFVQSSSLKHVETGFWWTPLPNEYPKSITTIAIRFEDCYSRFADWLYEFSSAIDPVRSTFFADHPYLTKILLYLPSRAYDERDRYQGRQRTSKALCWKHRVQLKIFYKDFECEHRDRGPFLSYPEPCPKKNLASCYVRKI
ncbi:MAG: hypothetical protein Q9168_003198 [Polycauliona sp. 1 TL-2023]